MLTNNFANTNGYGKRQTAIIAHPSGPSGTPEKTGTNTNGAKVIAVSRVAPPQAK